MQFLKKIACLFTILAIFLQGNHQLEAVTYVTDCGGKGYDQAIAATNLAPAVALATVAIVAIIAIGVQNSHGHHSSSSSHGHFSPSSSSSSSYSRSSS